MPTNTDMTLFHNKKGTFKKDYIEFVMWQGGDGYSISKGYENANNVDVWIPISKNDLSNISFNAGDIIIEGNINLNNITSEYDLKEYKTYKITEIVENKHGSLDLQHIFIGAK